VRPADQLRKEVAEEKADGSYELQKQSLLRDGGGGNHGHLIIFILTRYHPSRAAALLLLPPLPMWRLLRAAFDQTNENVQGAHTAAKREPKRGSVFIEIAAPLVRGSQLLQFYCTPVPFACAVPVLCVCVCVAAARSSSTGAAVSHVCHRPQAGLPCTVDADEVKQHPFQLLFRTGIRLEM
jgi:hypothetical protein